MYSIYVSQKILSSITVFNINNNYKLIIIITNYNYKLQHIKMISEGSCEDWSNNAENSALASPE